MPLISFPQGFLWGAATSAYQIEGSSLEDGACPSIWRLFSHSRGRIKDRTTGDQACDHYHRYKEDVRLMKDMGLKAYRFSIAWPRIIPEAGRINPKGLDFYSRLIDRLLESGIEPFPTLFHWDVPEWLEKEGGFRSRKSVDHCMSYAAAVISRVACQLNFPNIASLSFANLAT
jgi:beta-glucosidase